MKFLPITLILFFIALLNANVQPKGTGIAFERKNEPKEQAFSLLVPRGWRVEGGIFRVNPLQAGGPLNSIEAKCDLLLQSPDGSVSFHILPDIVYAHVGIGAGLFPPGSAYQGAEVRQMVDARTFLTGIFTGSHPAASGAKTVKLTHLPGEKKSLDQGLAYTNQLLAQIGLAGQSYQSDAAGGVFEYMEQGVAFREVWLTGIINQPAALTWKNTRTLAFRAPAKNFDQWRPVMDVIRFSIRFNPQWILKEAEGQQQRVDFVMKIYAEIRRIDQEIIQKTTINREEIMNDNFLVLTEQEEYVNPHNGQIEVDTDAFRFRWVTPGGDTYFTNREDEDPNLFLQRTDYKRSAVRKRRNE